MSLFAPLRGPAASLASRFCATAPAWAPMTRAYSLDKFKDKEAVEERMYFNKEDEKLLRGLLSKMKAQAEVKDTSRSHADKERSALVNIVGKYNVSNADIENLLDWRHRSDF